MTLLGPPSGMWYPHAHVNAHRTWYTPGAPPPSSISRAHVDYNYPQVITTHTTVFQWALTAIRPLYSAKLVFPFSVEENRTEIAKGRDRDGDRKKEETSGDRWLILDSTSPALTPFLPSVTPSSPLTAIHGRVYFCNLLEDRQLDFLGSFGYRISARLRRSGLDSGRPKRSANTFPGEWPRGPPTPASYNSAFSYLISSKLSERVRLNMHGAVHLLPPTIAP